jgi:hypothetical protein
MSSFQLFLLSCGLVFIFELIHRRRSRGPTK